MKTKLIQVDHKVFEGIYNEQMPRLVEEGYKPLTSKDIMEYRVKALKSKDKNEIDLWINKYWYTSTGLVYFNNDLIVVSNFKELLDINKKSYLNDRALEIKERYEKLLKENEAIKRDKIISGRNLSKKEAKDHPIWNKLAQDDKSLLDDYVEAIFDKVREVHSYNENMGIYLPDDQDVPLLRCWRLRGLGIRSGANARGDFCDDARLFGVREKNLESILGNIVLEEKLNNPDELRKA